MTPKIRARQAQPLAHVRARFCLLSPS